MKTFATKYLIIATIAAIGYFICESPWLHADRSAVVSASPALQETVASAASVPVANPLANVKASLRFKLRQWQESRAQDPDNEEAREQLMKEMLALLTDENVAQIVQSLTPEEMKTEFGIAALGRWMKVNPAAASNWLAAQSDPTREQTTAVAEGWIGNHDGMEQYLDQLSDSAWKQNLVETIGAQTMVRDPRLSLEMAQQMNPGDAQTNLLKAIACAWMSSDPQSTTNWIASVKDSNLSDQLIASAAQSYALTDPAQAATWLVSEVKSEEVIEKTALNIVSSWLIKDPQGAADWVAQFPNGQAKVLAIQKVATRWRLTDAAAVDVWLQQFSPSPQTN